MMEYKGFLGSVEYDDDAANFHGEVINTRDVITFQGKSVAELKSALRESVDDYLAFCAERGEAPDKPFSGQFVARVSPELHRRASLAASRAGKSLNAWVAEQLQSAVDGSSKAEHRNAAATKSRRSDKTVRAAKGAQTRSRS